MKESQLYLISSLISFLAFLFSLKYIYKHNSLQSNSYEDIIILILGLLSLSKSIEYYEKYIFKISNNH